MAIKNQALVIPYLAWDTANNTGKTGDVANHTLRVVKDGVAAAPTNNPVELDPVNLKGIYTLALTATEMNANSVLVGGVSSTANIVISSFTVITENGFLRAIARKDNTLENAVGGTYDNTTMSVEAQYAAAAAAILHVIPLCPSSIDLANTATVRLGLGLHDSISVLPTTGEIAPGTITIERKAMGGTSWTAIRSNVAMSEAAGIVYYDEVFSTANGYSEGDSIRVTFKSVSVTIGSVVIEACGSTGLMFQTSIRQSSVTLAAVTHTGATIPTVGAVTTPVSIASGQIFMKKNAAFTNFPFEMHLSDGSLATAILASDLTCLIQQDSGTFAALTATPVAKTNGGNKTGAFRVDLSQAETNAGVITLMISALGCRTTVHNFITQP
jgi:hypothetical protein